jgi:hypothetical protein
MPDRTVLLVRCPCGTEFGTTEARKRTGRGLYCSRRCMYAYRVRPTGLHYEIKVRNRAWYTSDDPRRLRGEDHPAWKGDDVGYRELHRWVRNYRGEPGPCEYCGSDGYTEWANKSHSYLRDLDDWLALCRKCHSGHDSGPNRGMAVARYGAKGLR